MTVQDKKNIIIEWGKFLIIIIGLVISMFVYADRIGTRFVTIENSNKIYKEEIEKLENNKASKESVDDIKDRLDRIENKLDVIITTQNKK